MLHQKHSAALQDHILLWGRRRPTRRDFIFTCSTEIVQHRREWQSFWHQKREQFHRNRSFSFKHEYNLHPCESIRRSILQIYSALHHWITKNDPRILINFPVDADSSLAWCMLSAADLKNRELVGNLRNRLLAILSNTIEDFCTYVAGNVIEDFFNHQKGFRRKNSK